MAAGFSQTDTEITRVGHNKSFASVRCSERKICAWNRQSALTGRHPAKQYDAGYRKEDCRTKAFAPEWDRGRQGPTRDPPDASKKTWRYSVSRLQGLRADRFRESYGLNFSKRMHCIEGAPPRTNLGHQVYISTEFPPKHRIALRDGLPYSLSRPVKTGFSASPLRKSAVIRPLPCNGERAERYSPAKNGHRRNGRSIHSHRYAIRRSRDFENSENNRTPPSGKAVDRGRQCTRLHCEL